MAVPGLESYAVVVVDEVDLANRLVHIKDKTGSKFQAFFRDHPGGVFYVPNQGERWTAKKVGNFWHLEHLLDTTDEHDWAVAHLKPGDLSLRGGIIYINGEPLGSSAGAVAFPISQVAHGFTVGQIVMFNGTHYSLAMADTASDAEVIGIVTKVTDLNDFDLTVTGQVSGLSGLTPGAVYFLSANLPGGLTGIEPTTPGQVSKPLLIAVAADTGYFFNFRGEIVVSSPGPGTMSSDGVPGLDGQQGPPGPSGPGGLDGLDGLDGPRGLAGATGVTGVTGSGVTGSTGVTGAAGLDGIDGDRGATGVTGTTGVSGTTGVTGVTGITGSAGTTGVTGVTGTTGVTGIEGLHGMDGQKGVTGTTGVTGVTGVTGATGVNGVTGVTGATGTAGTTGVTGNTGVTGSTGVDGIPGLDGQVGPQGITGVTGVQGVTGVTGAGVTGVTGVTGSTGPGGGNTGVTGVTGPDGLPGFDGQLGSTGVTGATGVSGVAGTTGVTGVTGNTGVTGVTGVTGITGPAGLDGIDGDKGITGATGVTGVTGSAGTTGTTGVTGVTGTVGTTGVTGVTGVTGAAGLDGIDGDKGVTGVSGVTGATGVTGVTGTTGTTGTTGVTGVTGATGVGVAGLDGLDFSPSSIQPTTRTVLSAASVLEPGISGQNRAGRVFTLADYTTLLGLTAPVALYNLGDTSDISGNARTLTNKGTVTFTTGITGTATEAAQFTGSTAQALYIVDAGAGDPFRIQYGSFGCWFQVSKSGVNSLLMSKQNAAQSIVSWALGINSGNILVMDLSTNGTSFAVNVNAITSITNGRWHFAVVTYDGAVASLYLDTVLEVVSTAATGPLGAAAAPLNIGAGGADGSTAATQPHYGRIDEAFITSDVLSISQIRMLYAAKTAHGAAFTPTATRLGVRRRSRGGSLATGNFSSTPKHLYNFTAGALTDAGSLATTLTNNNTAVAAPGADGARGNAFNLVAASTQFLSATDTGLPTTTASRSVGCWFKGVGLNQTLISYGTVGTGITALSIESAGALQSSDGTTGVSGGVCNDGLWHFGALVWDNAALDGLKVKVFVDAKVTAGGTSLAGTTLGGAGAFRIGQLPNGTQKFDGQIDGVFVTDYAMTPDEMASLYAVGSLALGASPKEDADHVEQIDATNIYTVFDTLDSQHQIDLAVAL